MEASLERYRFGVLTVSDTRTEETDLSGPEAEDALVQCGAVQVERAIVRDEIEEIRSALLDMCSRCDAVFTTGGTGFSRRDVTPEATLGILERNAEGLSDYLRMEGLKATPMSYLSRGIAGMRGSALIVNLPGSPNGARDGIRTLAPLLPHILSQARQEDGGHE